MVGLALLQPLGHLHAEAAAERRVLGRRLEVAAPARVAHDANVRAPAVKADVGQVGCVVLADALQPERAELDAYHLAHAAPDRPVEARAERVGVGEGRRAAAIVGAARLHAVDAVSSPVVLRDAEAADVSPGRVARDEERRLLLEREQREQVVDPGLQRQLRVAEIVRVVRRSAGTGDGWRGVGHLRRRYGCGEARHHRCAERAVAPLAVRVRRLEKRVSRAKTARTTAAHTVASRSSVGAPRSRVRLCSVSCLQTVLSPV